MATLKIVHDAGVLAQVAADLFVADARQAVAARGTFAVALSGGSTPKMLYERLASDEALRSRMPWSECRFCFGDERHVPPDHPDSNFRMAHEALLSRVPVSDSQVFRIKGELESADAGAHDYEGTLRDVFHVSGGEIPRFDLVLLGLGADGHVASLFPGTSALNEKSRLVAANWVDLLSAYRITLTLPVLNHAGHVVFLVQGAEKADVLKRVLEGPREAIPVPAALIEPQSGAVTWLVDRDAARLLTASPSDTGLER